MRTVIQAIDAYPTLVKSCLFVIHNFLISDSHSKFMLHIGLMASYSMKICTIRLDSVFVE